MDALTSAVIEWNAAGRALDDEGGSGDRYLVKPFAHGALVAVADGLGHGPEAAVAARTAMATLEAEADADRTVTALLRRCHERLRPTRGAALSLASFNALDGTMAWVGVGSVEAVLLRAAPAARTERLVLLGGVVGRQLPPLRASAVTVSPGDTVILVTDGIRGDFAERLVVSGVAGPSAERILARYAKGTDDALVVVVRYRGGERDERGRVAG